jgi:23S rRNA pseudouridine1911/1915/1917 synthase
LNADVHAQAQRDSAGQRVRKEYLAVVLGAPAPATGTIALPLARSISDRRRVVVDPCGQESETRYEVISQLVVKGRPEGRPLHDFDEVSLVRCELVTGRTHQIRVHLAARGWPVLGDAIYGEPHPAVPRQALHAWRASMPHPVTRAPLTIEAPLPTDLRPLFDQNRTL